MEAIPGSPAVSGLTATRPGTPTANKTKAGNSAGQGAPLPQRASGQRCLSPHAHACTGQSRRHPRSWHVLSEHQSLPVASALWPPSRSQAGTAATGPSSASAGRPAGRGQLPSWPALSDSQTARPAAGPGSCVLGDGSGPGEGAPGEAQGLGGSGSREQAALAGGRLQTRQQAALGASHRGPASWSVPGEFTHQNKNLK